MARNRVPVKVVHETPRLRLRELGPDDAAFILELVNEPGWLRFVGDRNVHSLEDARGYIARGPASGYARFGYGLWAVEGLESGETLGMCGLIRRDSLPEPDVGFAFLARHHGHGYAREAAAAVVGLARERFLLARLLAITVPENTASRAVLEHVGFRFVKTFTWPENGTEEALFALELASPGLLELNRTVLRAQYGAALDMLENAIRACPDPTWVDPRVPVERQFWYLAFHTLWWHDHYLSNDEQGFRPPAPFTMDELDPEGRYPAEPYTRETLLTYLEHGRARARVRFGALTEAEASARSAFARRNMSWLELALYNLRHVQHHTPS
jgi:RimJ/RimL family protein N-acetyltransferase